MLWTKILHQNYLKWELYQLKIEECKNLMEHVNVFNGVVDQLTKVDVEVEEEDKALLLLTSLPDSCNNLITQPFCMAIIH